MKCLNKTRFDKIVWGRYFCPVINRQVQILKSKCIESKCDMSKYLIVLRRRNIAYSKTRDIPNYHK
jgi:hypothetical protein